MASSAAMSLATRCTHCGTIFKVVQDQLKVSEGWVRCGRCHQIFSALDGLFDLRREPPPARRRPASDAATPPEWQATQPMGIDPSGAPNAPGAFGAPGTSDVPATPAAPVVPAAPADFPAPPPSDASSDLPAFLLKARGPGAAAPTSSSASAWAGSETAASPSGELSLRTEPEPLAEGPGTADFAAAAPSAAPVPAPAPAAAPAPRGFTPLAEHPLAAPGSLPVTHEDDALDSRWLMSPARDGRSASMRVPRGQRNEDFADAEFPEDLADDLADELARSAGARPSADPPADPSPQAAADPADVGAAVVHPMPADAAASGAGAPGSAHSTLPQAAPADLAASASGGRANRPAPSAPSRAEGARAAPRRTRRPAEAEPEFVRRANRRAQWRHPLVRATLGVVALALCALLAAQAGFHFRDAWAARYPQTAPALAALCQALGCRLQAPLGRVGDTLVVESAGIVQPANRPVGPDGMGVYRLDVVLRNRGAYAVAVPRLEVTLKDVANSVVARRSLPLSELGYRSDTLAANQRLELSVLLASAQPVMGYDVDAYYP